MIETDSSRGCAPLRWDCPHRAGGDPPTSAGGRRTRRSRSLTAHPGAWGAFVSSRAQASLDSSSLAIATRRPGTRELLSTGAAAAVSVAMPAAAQAVIGPFAVGIAAAGAWTAPHERPRVLARAMGLDSRTIGEHRALG